MMKFMIGYQQMNSDRFLIALQGHRDHIKEVYFSWGNIPNGRGRLDGATCGSALEVQNQQLSELKTISESGIGLNLLLNGNCHGAQSLARVFFNKIGNCVDYLGSQLNLMSVTTTSPVIARFIKTNFPALKIRASVNMEIGTTQGMDYIAEFFDGYYMQREYNRNLQKIEQLKKWCDANGKELYLLANSGCLNHCSVHNFHDNLVAHESEIAAMDNAFEFRGLCHDYLRLKEKQQSFIRNTNFIRPEDIKLYDPYFTAAKLATRTNRNPVAVLDAYIRGSYSGNVMELLEPNHAEAFYPWILENSRFPDDFADNVMRCTKDCDSCSYCQGIFDQIKINLNIGENILC